MFHVVIIIVFVFGLRDLQFLSFTTSALLIVFIMVELIRVCGLWPLSELIESVMANFRDEQDRGLLTMTPIYLLVGSSLPVWLAGDSSHTLSIMSGIIAVGVGDMAASVAGALYGVHKWPGTNKSYEGSLASLVTQIGASIALWYMINSSLPGILQTVAIVIAAAIAAVAEAKTQQIDNLILPLYHNIALLTLKLVVPNL